MTTSRVRMQLFFGKRVPEPSPDARPIRREDIPALGQLMLAAYRGTIDYQGETLQEAVAEVRGTLAGQYGPFLGDCSFLIERDGKFRSACMITWSQELRAPFVAFSMTHPDDKNRGLATLLLRHSIAALAARGHSALHLVVTKENLSARHLYEKIGFRAYL